MSEVFVHKHPYPPFIPEDSEKLIIGTLPPPRFSTSDLLAEDVDFCYGSYHNSLWKFLDEIFELQLLYNNSEEAIQQRKKFLRKRKIGICDIVEQCERSKIDASDLGMKNVELRDIFKVLRKHPTVNTLLFIGGNSKNGPEYFFRRLLKEKGLTIELISNNSPRINKFRFENREIKTVSLVSSSGAANISIGSNPLYKELKRKDPDFNTFKFRLMQYAEYF